MGLSQADRNEDIVSCQGAVGDCKRPPAQHRTQPQEKIRSTSSKPRRPDRAVYVPRALRAAENADEGSHERKRTKQAPTPPVAKIPKAIEKSQPGTPKKADKNFINVYTPPHLRHQQSHTAPSIPDDTNETVPSVPTSDSAIRDSSYKDIDDNFYIGDDFANGQLGLYNPNFYYSDFTNKDDKVSDYDKYTTQIDNWKTNELDMALPENGPSIMHNGYSINYNKDEDPEHEELKRASEEINRSNKRIIKQSFHSDVLIISDPIEEEVTVPTHIESPSEVEPEAPVKEKRKLEPKLSLKREENDWEAVFDESGECLDPSLLEELTSTVGKVRISKAKNNYDQYQTKGQALFNGPYDEAFAHVVEVYDFPSEFKTNDLLSVFSEYKDTGFEIKWVDDTHALIVFSSAKIAAEVLSAQKPLVRCRPLHAATSESRNKAKKCAEFLQPYRQRPETCTALARRLVTGALGVKLSTARQERAEERRLISIAKEKKRQAALHKEAAWDGSLGT